MILTAKDKSNFLAYVMNKGPDDCWEWLGWMSDGYGYFSAGGKNYRAHRIAYYLKYGNDPNELCVLHCCDNPICCNPEHLFLGTHQDNMQDAARKGRQNGRNNNAKLTENNVREIKKLLHRNLPGVDIAKKFNVSIATITDIQLQRTWKHTHCGEIK